MALTTVLEPQDNLDVEVELLKSVTVTSGQNLARGKLVKLVGVFTSAAAVAGTNTGNATVGATTAADNASIGSFSVVMLTATTFSVFAPDGTRLKDGATGVAYVGQVGFTMTVGATPMVAGDSFTIAVTKNAAPTVSSFTTGSTPYTVMYDAVNATGGAVVGLAYREAWIKASEVDFGTGTDAEVRDALDALGIHLLD